jgi:hypothetical protein
MISGFMKSTTSMFRIAPDAERFWPELHEKFADLWRVAFYVISFVLLGYTCSRFPVFIPVNRGKTSKIYAGN